jgi:hypothetical protein
VLSLKKHHPIVNMKNPSKKNRTLLIVLFSLILITGCSKYGFEVGKPWNPEETPFFDDGVDVVDNLANLSGKWRHQQERLFDARVQLADLIAEVEILSVQTSSDLESETSKRIEVRIVEIMYGKAPSDTLPLVSRKNAPGYELVLRHEARLMGHFFLFVRWFDEKDNKLGNHFHLSPTSEEIRIALENRIVFRNNEEASLKDK